MSSALPSAAKAGQSAAPAQSRLAVMETKADLDIANFPSAADAGWPWMRER
jgi:hypothetical protein